MKIYSNILTESDVREAFTGARMFNDADIYLDSLRTWKPRAYARGVDVYASSVNGKRRSAHGDYPRAASGRITAM